MTNVTVQEALKAAIVILDGIAVEFGVTGLEPVIEQCKAALAEIEKCEPVGELILDPVFLPALKAPLVNWKINLVDLEVGTKFFTSPQPREWVSLSEEDKKELSHNVYANDHSIGGAITLVESKLKQLNTKG